MQKISFSKKLITCVIAGLVVGAFILRQCVTWLRTLIPIGTLTIIPLLTLVVAVIYAFIWQARKTNRPETLAFWQGLIRYGVAFDLASFGWEKICHLQLVMPISKVDLPYSSFSPSDLFWNFYSHSYLFACIIAGLQITGAMLLLFRRTRLVGVFVLIPLLANILLMDIFYEIGQSVVVHASIMLLGTLYFLFIEFNRLKEFFFIAKDQLPALTLSKYLKLGIRLSVIYIPLLLIALHNKPDRNPQLTGKYEVKQLQINQQMRYKSDCADSVLTVVYLDVRNGCVFEFNTPQKRWNGTYTLANNHMEINWRSPSDRPVFKGSISPAGGSGKLKLAGTLGTDSVNIIMQRL
ncbi:hypothetical protein [Chitinophaga filiformis]|uniref:Uncharacterized protein n=1 Tax=Chitinophaga filiformis TaxID=104663 RepID=A0A1G8BUK5_CHIFI|nr:hypothetical protein [Chitinophaga filiformis]SDH36794.1 hypothetical protein SAMN04488121_111162 [Chitinophaga filiformis]